MFKNVINAAALRALLEDLASTITLTPMTAKLALERAAAEPYRPLAELNPSEIAGILRVAEFERRLTVCAALTMDWAVDEILYNEDRTNSRWALYLVALCDMLRVELDLFIEYWVEVKYQREFENLDKILPDWRDVYLAYDGEDLTA